MHLSIISSETTIFDGSAEMVVLPGIEGLFGVMDRHAPFLTALKEGPITIYKNGIPEELLTITGGFADITPEKCLVLVDETVGESIFSFGTEH